MPTPGVLRATACVVLLVAATSIVLPQPSGQSPWKLSGQYLNLYTRSRTVVPEPLGFALDLNRLRLGLEAKPMPNIGLEVQYDNEALLGSYLRTEQYTLTAARVTTTYDLQHEYARGSDVVVHHNLYRAMVTWSSGNTDVRVGRQRIPLGTGYFWSPMDLLNPIDPTRLERDYRVGADAVLVEQRLGALGRIEGIYVPRTSRLASVGGGYLHGNLRGTDYSILAGRFRADDVFGVDLSTSRGGLGLRGEATATRAARHSRYARVLLGADYGFANSLTISGEIYYNGRGMSDVGRYDVAGVLAGRTLNVARWYLGTAASYQMTPLLKIAGYGVANIDDWSGVLWPRIEWSARADLDVVMGIQRFAGRSESEYGRMGNLAHAEVHWFF